MFKSTECDFEEIVSNEGWKNIGFQTQKAFDDFRGGGMLSLKALVYYFQNDPGLFKEFIDKQKGIVYPLACIVINSVFYFK